MTDKTIHMTKESLFSNRE